MAKLLLSGPPSWAHLSLPQRQVLYSASKGVVSEQFRRSVFFLWPPTEISHKKNLHHFFFVCSDSALPTKMTYGNLFIFFVTSPIAVGLRLKQC